MLVEFKKGAFNNFFTTKAIRKTQKTIALYKKAIEAILSETHFKIPSDRGIWVSTPQEELHTGSLDDAIALLEKNRKGAIFVTFTKDNTKFFVRWYDSDPQTDVLSIEGAFAIKNDKIIMFVDVDNFSDVLNIIKREFLDKLASEDLKELSKEFNETQQTTYFYDYLKKLGGS